jgi:hypothetical protein
MLVGTSGRCLDIHGPDASRDGGMLQTWSCHGGANQQWQLARGQVVSGAGKCLDAPSGDPALDRAAVQVWSCNGSTNQKWHVRGAGAPPPPPVAEMPPPSGWGRLRNQSQNMCLDVAGWQMQGNRTVVLWECNNDPDHVWTFSANGELMNAVGNLCLDAQGRDGAQGAQINVRPCNQRPDQKWRLVSRGGGRFELRNGARDLCLDVVGRAGARGDKTILWQCDGGADQLWRFDAAGGPAVVAPPPAPGPTYVPPPPPPGAYVPPPPPAAMDAATFDTLIGAVGRASFSSDKQRVIADAAARNWFTVAQADRVLRMLSFSADKLRALELMAPHIVDPQNAFQLYESFTFSADRQKAREIMDRAQRR